MLPLPDYIVYGAAAAAVVVAGLGVYYVKNWRRKKGTTFRFDKDLSLFDSVSVCFRDKIEFVADVLEWAYNLVERCIDKIQEGWRMYYVDVDVEKIPPSIIPRERLNGYKKLSLGIMTDKDMNPQKVDRVFVHNTEDDELAAQLGNKGVVELVL